eukprot:5845160-Amphidinium_carterae.1
MFWLLVGPKLPVRPDQWPRVRLPVPEPVPEVVVSTSFAEFPDVPFAVGPHQRVVEHETYVYAICLHCERHVGVHTGQLPGPQKPALRAAETQKKGPAAPKFVGSSYCAKCA